MNKTISRFLILFLLVILIAGIYALKKEIIERNTANIPEYQISNSTLHLLGSMNNDDVTWSGDYIGIYPIEMTGATLLLRDVPEEINPLLIEALLDKDKFIAAHVLLTYRITPTQFPALVPRSVNEWNSLIIQSDANGVLFFDINNMRKLQKYWHEKLQQ